MSLSREIAAAVDRHVAAGGGPGVVVAETGTSRLELSLSRASDLGVECEAIAFAERGGEPRSVEALRGWGDRLAARLTYLMEPLVVLEADPIEAEVVLRSQAPTARAERRSYYEARLGRDGSLRLIRVAFDADRRRRAVPFQLSREVLERLADDLAASVA